MITFLIIAHQAQNINLHLVEEPIRLRGAPEISLKKMQQRILDVNQNMCPVVVQGQKANNTLEVAEMETLHVGDRVKLTGVPDWLVHDLPEKEKREIVAFIGKVTMIDSIDSFGYYWLGFGSTDNGEDAAYYSGHSFCVPGEYLELV